MRFGERAIFKLFQNSLIKARQRIDGVVLCLFLLRLKLYQTRKNR